MFYYVYLLRLNNKTFYIGFSADLKIRITAHKNGEIIHTKNLNPKLVFYAAFASKKKALDFEKYLKTASGFAFRNKRLLR